MQKRKEATVNNVSINLIYLNNHSFYLIFSFRIRTLFVSSENLVWKVLGIHQAAKWFQLFRSKPYEEHYR